MSKDFSPSRGIWTTIPIFPSQHVQRFLYFLGCLYPNSHLPSPTCPKLSPGAFGPQFPSSLANMSKVFSPSRGIWITIPIFSSQRPKVSLLPGAFGPQFPSSLAGISKEIFPRLLWAVGRKSWSRLKLVKGWWDNLREVKKNLCNTHEALAFQV